MRIVVAAVGSDSTITNRGRMHGVYVLVVHEPSVDVTALCDTLRDSFVVREASDAFEVLERLSGTTLACVVCVIGGSIRGEDFYNLVARASPAQASRLVFVAADGSEPRFLERNTKNWLPGTAAPSEVVAVVRAVGASG